jgi:ADP-heptose:LPS heptosyltransferase
VIESDRNGESWFNLLRPRLLRHFDVIIDTKRKLRATAELRRMPHGLLISGTANGLLSERRAPGQPFKSAKPQHFQAQLLQLLSLARYGRVDGPVDPSGTVEIPASCHAAAARLLPEDRGVLVAPGAGGADKRWPLERFLEVGRRLSADGWLPVFALGPREASLREEITRALPEARLPLQQADAAELEHEPFLTMACAQRCRAAIGNDSGNAHIVAAAGTPILVLFGRTSAAKFAPRGERVYFLKAADFGSAAMGAISVDDVWHKLKAVLDEAYSSTSAEAQGS